MKKALTLTLLLSAFSLLVFAQSSGEPLEYGARAQGMGNATVTMDGTWSLFHNQAGIARMESIGAGAFYQSRFSLQELSTAGFGVALPAAGGTFGLSYVRYGYTAYREQRIGLAYGRQIGEKLDVGVQLDYIGIFLGGSYGSSQSFTFQGGAIYKASEAIELAFHVFNPIRATFAEFNDERLPTVLRAGASYRFSDRVILRGEVRKHIDYDPSLAIGLEYELIEHLYLRAGAAGAPSRFSFGAGYRLGAVALDISAGYNEVLGYSPQLSFTYHGR